MNLKIIGDDELIFDLKNLIENERELLTSILRYLKEVEVRKLYLQRGYASLFAFLTEAMGYSEGAAQRRIQAMRLIKDVPEVEKKLQSGEISLSVASQVQSYIKKESKKAPIKKPQKLKLINSLAGTSSRECERELIKLSPETALPKDKTKMLTAEKTLVQFVADASLMDKIEKLKSLTSHQNPEGKYEILFTKALDLALDKLDPAVREARRRKRSQNKLKKEKSSKASTPGTKNHPKPKTSVIPNSTNNYKNQKSEGSLKDPPWAGPVWSPAHGGKPTCDEFSAKRPKDESSKSLINSCGKAPFPQLLVRRPTEHPKQFPQTTPSPPTSAVTSSRYIPQKLRDKVHLRDQGKCQHRNNKTGKICGSRYQVEFDHHYPFALGGENSETNLRLRCRGHNLWRAGAIS